jgi:hypothetical protein
MSTSGWKKRRSKPSRPFCVGAYTLNNFLRFCSSTGSGERGAWWHRFFLAKLQIVARRLQRRETSSIFDKEMSDVKAVVAKLVVEKICWPEDRTEMPSLLKVHMEN